MNTPKMRENVYKTLLSDGLIDTWSVAPIKDDGGCKFGSYHGWRPSLEGPQSKQVNDGEQCIDWILYREGTAKYAVNIQSANIFTDHSGSAYPSDHFPISASFTLEHS